MTTRRSLLRPCIVSLVALGVLILPGTAPATAVDPPVVPTLVSLQADHVGNVDRLVFQFAGGVPTARADYVSNLVADASGKRVRVAGRALLRLVFTGADAHTAAGSTLPRRTAYDLPNVLTTVRAGDFEAVTTYGVGLARQTAYRVTTDQVARRIVVEINAGFATVRRGVWFTDTPAFVANTPPFAAKVWRSVPARYRVVGALDRLFAGPLPHERAAGLRLVRSHATGFADLRISDGVARVRLTGGCNSNGSTLTIAGEIMPTLRQFASVRWVKIYDPSGHTESPNGDSDSIPFCLEP